MLHKVQKNPSEMEQVENIKFEQKKDDIKVFNLR